MQCMNFFVHCIFCVASGSFSKCRGHFSSCSAFFSTLIVEHAGGRDTKSSYPCIFCVASGSFSKCRGHSFCCLHPTMRVKKNARSSLHRKRYTHLFFVRENLFGGMVMREIDGIIHSILRTEVEFACFKYWSGYFTQHVSCALLYYTSQLD